MHVSECYLLGLVQEHAVRLSVARGEDDLTVVTAIWQAPGPLALQLVLNLTAQAAITFCKTFPAASVCWCMAGTMLIWDNRQDMTSTLKGKIVMKSSSLCLLLGICLRLVHDALSAQGGCPLVVGRHIVPVREEHVLCPAQLLHPAS